MPAALAHITVGYPVNEHMRLLERSARRNGLATRSLPQTWHRPAISTINKLTILRDHLQTGGVASEQILLFTDAYDVLIIDNAESILHKFINLRSDLVFNAESNFYPPAGRDSVKQFFDKFPSKRRYLNSGCCIGYAWAISAMIDQVLEKPTASSPAHWADQALAQEFFIDNYGSAEIRVSIDTECRVFATLNQSADDYVFDRSTVRNEATGNTASVLHANGDKRNLAIIETAASLLEHSTPYDIRLGTSGDAVLEYRREAARLAWNENRTENTVLFVIKGNHRCVAVTVADGILTFCPQGVVHCDRDTVKRWEVLEIRGAPRSAHDVELTAYIDPGGRAPPSLLPAPLSLFREPLGKALAAIVPACYDMLP